MATYLTRESHSFSHGTSGGSRKKIKHFSYSPFDKIGKGFSSIVYRGTNDNTSTPSPTQTRSPSPRTLSRTCTTGASANSKTRAISHNGLSPIWRSF